MSIEQRVRAFIVDELQPRVDPAELTDDYPLLEGHVIDSMGIFEMVTFIEDEFSVKVDDEELVNDNFGTIRDIARLITQKQSAPA